MLMEEIKKVTLKDIDNVINLIFETSILYNTSNVLKNDLKSKKIFSSMFKESFNNMETFGYYANDELVGVIGIEDNNYIPILYVKNKFQNHNIGTSLLNYVINYVKDNTDILEVCSEEKAVQFYLNNGFNKYNNDYADKVMMYYNFSKKKGEL